MPKFVELLVNFNDLVPGLAVILNGLSTAPPVVITPPDEMVRRSVQVPLSLDCILKIPEPTDCL